MEEKQKMFIFLDLIMSNIIYFPLDNFIGAAFIRAAYMYIIIIIIIIISSYKSPAEHRPFPIPSITACPELFSTMFSLQVFLFHPSI